MKSDRPLTRNERRMVVRHNAHRPEVLAPVPRDQWPPQRNMAAPYPVEVWASRHFAVQVFSEGWNRCRLSVNRVKVGADGRWRDGITWDELQEIKRQVGRGDQYALEIYPRDCDVVNDANMRHLWVYAEPLDIGWFRHGRPGGATQ